MTLECASCGKPVQLTWKHCPNCGTRIEKPTPEQAKAAVKAIEAVKARLSEDIDTSPEGRLKVMGYVDSVTELLTKYGQLLHTLIRLNDMAKENPMVLREKHWEDDDESWKMNVKIVLLALGVTSEGILDPPNPKTSMVPYPPQGCAWVGVLLSQLNSSTRELVTSYDTFVDSEDRSALEEAGRALKESSDGLNKALDAVDDLIEKVSR